MADEGMWPPEQLVDVDQPRLRRMGLSLSMEDLWSERGGLMRAAVNLSGCSAAFVSKGGLVVTNHHCVYRVVQRASTVETNLLRDGFLARKRSEEIEAKGLTVTVLSKVTDVTARVRAAADAAKSDEARFLAVERVGREIVRECEQKPGARCTLGALFRGAEFRLHEGMELRDVRLVYAPPAAVGEYGGDIDNWQWPRHTGDFAFVRAYATKDGAPGEFSADNVPFAPAHHLEIGPDGVRSGDFVASMGYPFETHRLSTLAETRRFTDELLPAVADLYGEWVAVLDRHARTSDALALVVAGQKKSLANRQKNAVGRLEGIRKNRLVARKEAARKKMEARAKKESPPSNVLAALDAITADASKSFARTFVLSSLPRGPNLLAVALDVVRRAREAEKPDAERAEPYTDRNLVRTSKGIEQRLHGANPDVDADLLAVLVVRAAALPADQRVPALAALAPAGAADLARVAASLRPKLRATKLRDAAFALRAWKDGTWASHQKSADPLIRLAVALVPAIEAAEAEERARSGALLALAPSTVELIRATRRGPVYPDANGTLRISFAKVAGYSPQEGLTATPFTTLGGALAKHTGKHPFHLPDRVREAARNARDAYWASPESEDVPTCFLSNADTSGGNSGSPMIDGRGRLVGVNFDRVWENVSGDHGYSAKKSRNVSVDVRYILWLLDRVDDAGELLDELGAAHLRSAPRRAVGTRARKADAPPPAPQTPPANAGGGRCSAGAPRQGDVPLALTLLALAWLARSRPARRLRQSVREN